ncbi:MAG: metallophosphoesterase family protein [Tepidisphaeraceae bacterium]
MLGVVSNSDGRAEALAAAVDLFSASGVEYVVHCGDVGGRHVLDALGRFPGGGAFVWGDRDVDRMGLMRYGNGVGVGCFGLLGEFEWEDRKLAVIHGDDRAVLKKLVDEQQYDYVLCGHAMEADDRTVGRTRVLNPGPLHGTGAKSVLLLEPLTGKVRLVPI